MKLTRIYENPVVAAKICPNCGVGLITILTDGCDCVKLTCPNCGGDVVLALAYRRHRKREYLYTPNRHIKIGEKVVRGNEILIKITKDGMEDYISFSDLVSPFLNRMEYSIAVPPTSDGYFELR